MTVKEAIEMIRWRVYRNRPGHVVGNFADYDSAVWCARHWARVSGGCYCVRRVR